LSNILDYKTGGYINQIRCSCKTEYPVRILYFKMVILITTRFTYQYQQDLMFEIMLFLGCG